MSSVGETLRRERLRSGLDLEKIAQDTKISVHILELIESDQFEKLPGGVFARSFVRQYARAVGVDAEEIVSELEKVLAPKTALVPRVQDASRAAGDPEAARLAMGCRERLPFEFFVAGVGAGGAGDARVFGRLHIVAEEPERFRGGHENRASQQCRGNGDARHGRSRTLSCNRAACRASRFRRDHGR